MPPAGSAPAAAGPRVRSFECDRDVLSPVRAVGGRDVSALSLSRLRPGVASSHVTNTDSVHKCNSEKINVPL